MKKKELKKRLSLNKQTINKLNDNEMTQINGGEMALFTLFEAWCDTSTMVDCGGGDGGGGSGNCGTSAIAGDSWVRCVRPC